MRSHGQASSDDSVKEAIAAATGLRKGDFGLKDAADGVVVAVSAGSFAQGATYETIALKAGACPYEHTGVIHQVRPPLVLRTTITPAVLLLLLLPPPLPLPLSLATRG